MNGAANGIPNRIPSYGRATGTDCACVWGMEQVQRSERKQVQIKRLEGAVLHRRLGARRVSRVQLARRFRNGRGADVRYHLPCVLFGTGGNRGAAIGFRKDAFARSNEMDLHQNSGYATGSANRYGTGTSARFFTFKPADRCA